MNEENFELQKGITFNEILFLLRANLLLMVLIVLFSVVAGAVYAKVRKPYYTATEQVSYSADVGTTDDTRIIKNYNAMNAYIGTAVDFCCTGVVLECANSYYAYYLNYGNKNPDGLNIDEFIEALRSNPEEYPSLTEEELKNINYFSKSNVNSKATSSNLTSNTDMTSFTISVKGLDKDAVREKVRILAVAANYKITDYFGGVTSTIIELTERADGIPVSADMSTKKVVFIAVLIGVVLGVAVVLIKYLLDNTVKDKATLERITGSNVIAYIEDVRGGNYGRTPAN